MKALSKSVQLWMELGRSMFSHVYPDLVRHRRYLSEGVTDVAPHHVDCCKVVAEPVVRLRISRVFVDAAYDEVLRERMGFHL